MDRLEPGGGSSAGAFIGPRQYPGSETAGGVSSASTNTTGASKEGLSVRLQPSARLHPPRSWCLGHWEHSAPQRASPQAWWVTGPVDACAPAHSRAWLMAQAQTGPVWTSRTAATMKRETHTGGGIISPVRRGGYRRVEQTTVRRGVGGSLDRLSSRSDHLLRRLSRWPTPFTEGASVQRLSRAGVGEDRAVMSERSLCCRGAPFQSRLQAGPNMATLLKC